jgi:hypothetical protein
VSEPRERAWDDIHDLLPDRWRVGPPTYEPGWRRWSVTARSPKYSGRLRPPATVSGAGEDEIAALTQLANRLREVRDAERRMALEEKSRSAYLQDAEEHSRATLGRPLMQDELERVLARYR